MTQQQKGTSCYARNHQGAELEKAKLKGVCESTYVASSTRQTQRWRTGPWLPGGRGLGVTSVGSTRESFVAGGQLCVLVEVVVTQIYTCGDKTEPHTRCANVSFLALMLSCNHLRCK